MMDTKTKLDILDAYAKENNPLERLLAIADEGDLSYESLYAQSRHMDWYRHFSDMAGAGYYMPVIEAIDFEIEVDGHDRTITLPFALEGFALEETDFKSETLRPFADPLGMGYISPADLEHALGLEEDSLCDEPLGLLMNYAWPLPSLGGLELHEAAMRIAHLPLCIVLMEVDSDDKWNESSFALALTAKGGMDLSYEIAEGYIQLGFMPPFAVDVSGSAPIWGSAERRAKVLHFCKESALAVSAQATRRYERLAAEGR